MKTVETDIEKITKNLEDVNNHAQIWAGNGMVWESADSWNHPETACVRHESYERLADNFYYNAKCILQDSVHVRYCRPTTSLIEGLNG